jgi:hypothetical protein
LPFSNEPISSGESLGFSFAFLQLLSFLLF